MPRRSPPDRYSKLLDVAAAAFVEHGYHRTQMDDIAERLGVSKGTIYRAVDSKDALFAAVINWADTPELIPPMGLDTTSGVAAVASELTGELAAAIARLELTTIVTDRKRLRSAEGFSAEIERLTVGLHRLMHARRTAIMVLDRCSAELPELAAIWFGEGRYAVVDLWQNYLALRASHVTTRVDPTVLARTIVEIVTTWAVKISWDPAPRPYPDDTAAACATMVSQLVAADRR